MNDNVISEMSWDKGDFIIKIQIPLFRATPPARPLVTNTDPTNGQFINLIKIFNSRQNQSPCQLFML